MYDDSLKRHMRTKHPTDESEEKAIKRSKENDGFRNVKCNICGQVFGSQKQLETHIRHKCKIANAIWIWITNTYFRLQKLDFFHVDR